MIFRVRDPPVSATSSVSAPPPAQALTNHRSPISEGSEADIDSIEATHIDPSAAIGKRKHEVPQPKLSYIDSTEDPFEEIVIRAETYFPGLTNIVGNQASSYIVEQTNYEPSAPSQRRTAPPRQHLPTVNSNTRQNPFNTSIAESKRRGEEEIDRRIMMYSHANRKPRTHHGHSLHANPYQQGSPIHSVIHYGGYYSQNLSNPQPPCTSESDMDERTTYDYRDFQAARQRFEQRGLTSQAALLPPRNPLHRIDLRPQHSITSTVMSTGPNRAGFGVSEMVPMHPPHPSPSHSSMLQPQFVSQPNTSEINQEGSALVRREPRNLFSGGCSCGPGSGCGALPESPIRQEHMVHREAIQKYLVAEEVGPGGVKSVFSFPGGVEPSDLTLLRAAISANQPKDAFIPEENDDLEEQLNRQLEQACPDIRTFQENPIRPTQPPQPPHHAQPQVPTVGRTSGGSMMVGGGGQSRSQYQTTQKPNIVSTEEEQALSPHSNTENPLNTLMYNGIIHQFAGPSNPSQLQSSSRYPMQNQAQLNNWHNSPQHRQPMQGHYQNFTTYNSTGLDSLPVTGGRSTGPPTHLNSENRFMI
ncbi:unnamed protein product [Mesocestoides corti]|uniref:SH2 domain-containing protein n=1 Tax=Mesocestoides corti TaxID=53468 RepID=A0A0R3U9A9_MESCO|nr:unnamed protein product [Mesocestoides corti]